MQQQNKVPRDKSNDSCAKLFWRNYITLLKDVKENLNKDKYRALIDSLLYK